MADALWHQLKCFSFFSLVSNGPVNESDCQYSWMEENVSYRVLT